MVQVSRSKLWSILWLSSCLYNHLLSYASSIKMPLLDLLALLVSLSFLSQLIRILALWVASGACEAYPTLHAVDLQPSRCLGGTDLAQKVSLSISANQAHASSDVSCCKKCKNIQQPYGPPEIFILLALKCTDVLLEIERLSSCWRLRLSIST